MTERDRKAVPAWYVALIEELESLIEVNHEERQRRMDELHKDLEKQQKSGERR